MRQVIFSTAAADEIRRKVSEDACLSFTSPYACTACSTLQNANAAWSQCHGLDAGNTPIHRPHKAARTLVSDTLARHAPPCFGAGTFGGKSTEFSFRVTSLRHLVTLTLHACHAKNIFARKGLLRSNSCSLLACNAAKTPPVFSENVSLSYAVDCLFDRLMLHKNRVAYAPNSPTVEVDFTPVSPYGRCPFLRGTS